MRELGVGLVYWPELEPLFDAGGLVDVLELEPQTFWRKREPATGTSYVVNEEVLLRLASRSQAKLLHGVDQPIGGTVGDPLDYLAAWTRTINYLDPAWISEHLSFNRVRTRGAVEHTGFLLPPKQCEAGVAVAVQNIRRFSSELRRPVAFETGVNYLQRHSDEWDDGDFFGAVANRADCGILLDLHNLWCNEQNGRTLVAETLRRLPLERVWELHLAGGMKRNGYWLDAHSDVVPPGLLEIAAGLIPKLPALGAIVFEILPSHLEGVGLDRVARQLEALHSLWALRQPRHVVPATVNAMPSLEQQRADAEDIDELSAWERALLGSLFGRPVNDGTFDRLGDDPGIAVWRQLIREARRSALARALKYTMTLLLLHLGTAETSRLLNEYCETVAADPYAATEADHFATFLLSRTRLLTGIPYLAETFAYEHALVRATLYAKPTRLTWSTDPTQLFAALDAGRVPRDLPNMRSTLNVRPQ